MNASYDTADFRLISSIAGHLIGTDRLSPAMNCVGPNIIDRISRTCFHDLM